MYRPGHAEGLRHCSMSRHPQAGGSEPQMQTIRVPESDCMREGRDTVGMWPVHQDCHLQCQLWPDGLREFPLYATGRVQGGNLPVGPHESHTDRDLPGKTQVHGGRRGFHLWSALPGQCSRFTQSCLRMCCEECV
uniref:(northern house mosquito) hypothetical protein n=1 Tax=Culex pipiens TaxID=7175 RepID=A0A8D8B623_CULPI